MAERGEVLDRGSEPSLDAAPMDDEGDSRVIDGSTRDLRAIVMNILSPIAAALGTMSATLLVLGLVVVTVAALLGLACWLLVQTFTTVGG